MLTGFLPLLTALFSEVPQTQGNAVNGGVAGGAGGPAGGGTGDPNAGPGAADPNAASPGQPSPQDANQVIEDARFYILNPSDPTGSRTMGLHLREAMVRAGQFDNLQSTFHQTESERNALRAENAQLTERLAEYERQNSLMTTLQRMGVELPNRTSLHPQTYAGLPNPNGQGVQTPQGIQQQPGQDYSGVTNQWGTGDTTGGAWGFNQDPQGVSQQGMPNAPGTQNIPGMQNVPGAQPGQPGVPPNQTVPPSQQQPVSFDPSAFAQALRPVLQTMVNEALGNVDQRTQQAVTQNFQKLQEQQTMQDQITSAFSGSRATRAQALRADGLPEDRIVNILDLEDTSHTLSRQAEALFGEGGQQNVALGHQKLQQSEALRAQAMNDRVNAKLQFQQVQQRQNYNDLINTDPYRALGVDQPEQMDNALTDPVAIQQAVQANFDKALQLAQAQDRVGVATGAF